MTTDDRPTLIKSQINKQTEKPSRPTGVWILTIWAGLFAGIIPVVVAIGLFVTAADRELMTPFSLVLTLFIDMGVIISAFWTWRGNNRGRIAFLIFVTLHYGLVGLNNALMLISGEASVESARLTGRIIRGFLWPAIYIWYFNRSETREFYQLY